MQYILNNNGIVLFIDNKPLKFERGSMQYAKILEKFDLPEAEQDAAIREVIQKTSPNAEKNGFKISPESVSYLGEELPKSLADKVRAIHEEGLPLSLFEKFWQNLQLNPSSSSVRELYEFLSYKELPLTEDGCFLAYKGLDSNFWSISGNKETKVISGQTNASGKIFNGVGEKIEVRRWDVDDNRANHCSFGLHAGSLDYARGFSQGAVVVVKINPKDVVSVPTDCKCQKCRVSAYEVVSVFEQEITAPVVDADNNPIEDESNASRSEFIDRVANYLENKLEKGFDQVSVRSIRNSFSPEYPDLNRVLDAIDSLGHFWVDSEDGKVVLLSDDGYSDYL